MVYNNKRGRGIISLMLVVSMVFALSAPIYATVDYNEDGIIKGTFKFSPHSIVSNDLVDRFVYTDEFFAESALEYNPHLATMSMAVAAASISSLDVDYPIKSINLKNILTDVGFESFETNEAYTEKPTTETMGVAAAHKTIEVEGEEYTILAVIPRNAGYEKEWAGNFKFGDEGLHKGFEAGRDIVLDFAKEYVENHEITGEIKVWTVGYSRGAGVTNLVSGYLMDNPDYFGEQVTLLPENFYSYSFGTPLTVPNTDEYNPKDEKYKGIFTIYSDYDLVTMAPFAEFDFTRYGTEIELPTKDMDAKEDMLSFLKILNRTIYEMYATPNSSVDPDNFYPKKIEIGESGIGIVNDDDELHPAEKTQEDFLLGRIAFLVDTIIPDRETYVKTYQKPAMTMAGLFFGLSSDGMNTFIDAIAKDDGTKLAGIATYAYYSAKIYQSETATIQEVLDLLNAFEAENADTEYADIFNSEIYKDIKAELEIRAAAGDLITDEDIELVKGLAATGLGMALTSGLVAVDADQATKDEVLGADVLEPLVDLAAYVLFGSTDETVDPLNIDNDQIKMAATFIGNAGGYMRAHNNEIMISWLRTQDDYYSIPTPPSVDDTEVEETPVVPPTHNVSTNGTIKVDAVADEKGNASVEISREGMLSAIEKAKAQAKENNDENNGVSIVVDVNAGNKGTALTVNLPKTVQDAIITNKIVSLIIKSSNPETQLELDLAAINTISKQATGVASITIAPVEQEGLSDKAREAIGQRGAYNFTVMASGQEVHDFGTGSAYISVPYTLASGEQAGNVRVVYVDDNGQLQWLTNSFYDSISSKVQFAAPHFSVYGVGYQDTPVAADIASHWAKDNILFALNRGLLQSGADGLLPEGTVTLGQMEAALTTLSGKDMSGIIGNENLAQVAELRREQVAIILSNYAKAMGIKTPTVWDEVVFADSDKINLNYKAAVKQMQVAGVVASKDGNLFDPQGKVTRGETATMLRRFVEMSAPLYAAQGWVVNDSGTWTYYEKGKPSIAFMDTMNHKAEDSVKYVAKKGLMTGTSSNIFSPQDKVTRGMVATVLHRAAGTPEVTPVSSFKDIQLGMWYTNGVNWCANNGVVTGVGDSSFAPSANLTLQELAVVLYRYAKLNTQVTAPTNTNVVAAPWGVEAMAWCIENKVFATEENAGLNAFGEVNRAELALCLKNFIELVDKK